MSFRSALTIRSDTRYLAPLRGWLGAAMSLGNGGSISRRTRQECTLALIEAVVERHKPAAPLPPQQRSGIEAWRTRIETLVDKGVTPGAIFERLRTEEGFEGS